MRKLIHMSVISLLIVIILNGSAFGGDSELTPELTKKLQNSIKMDPHQKALINAVSNNNIEELSRNIEFHRKHDHLFNFKIEAKGITDQQHSGRCWLFAGFNMMRPAVIEKYNIPEFEFSESYLFFWDKLEKANLFLEAMIETRERHIDDREIQTLLDNPVPDGGWWNYVVNLIEKYGTVPKSVMPETKNTTNTGKMNKQLNRMARAFAADLREAAAGGVDEDELREKKVEMLKRIYRLLILHLGVPPEEFTWRVEDNDGEIIEKDFTPLSFYHETTETDLIEYVNIMDHAAHDYEKLYRIHYCRNMPGVKDMEFINLPVERLKEFALKALLNKEPVWFAADVGKANDTENGILSTEVYDYESLLGSTGQMSKSERVLYGESTPVHAMVFIGADLDEDKKARKWLVENSWGTDTGNKGRWTMYDEWFDKYVFSVIVHKRHIPDDVLAILDTKPEILPAWDPMRDAFEQPVK
jgi:bleomycin hydrolase